MFLSNFFLNVCLPNIRYHIEKQYSGNGEMSKGGDIISALDRNRFFEASNRR